MYAIRSYYVEAKALRHVADARLDLGRLGEQVVAETHPVPRIGLQQTAEHADEGGLAAAVRPQKIV